MDGAVALHPLIFVTPDLIRGPEGEGARIKSGMTIRESRL
jgi:hypothetical protein